MGSTGHFIGSDPFYKGSVRKYLDHNNTQLHGAVTYRVLASATRGGVYYAALERTQVGSGQRDVFALVEPYKIYGKGWQRELVVKDQDETMGPVDTDCPDKILDLLTDPINDHAKQWRERCRAKIAKPTPKVGDTILFARELNFGSYGKTDTFVVTSWGRKKRFIAQTEKPFGCRIDRWSLSNVDYVVI